MEDHLLYRSSKQFKVGLISGQYSVGRRMKHLALITADNKICVSNFFCPYAYLKFLCISFNCSHRECYACLPWENY